jgi:hypothetical protein
VDRLNAEVLRRVNADRRYYISHTALPVEGYILRVPIGNIRTTAAHVEALWAKIQEAARASDAALRPSLDGNPT